MKSLDKGPSAIVPIKAPKALRELLKAWLDEGETISDLTRKLWVQEITRRAAIRDTNPTKKSKRKTGKTK
jgi:hypothetical protein